MDSKGEGVEKIGQKTGITLKLELLRRRWWWSGCGTAWLLKDEKMKDDDAPFHVLLAHFHFTWQNYSHILKRTFTRKKKAQKTHSAYQHPKCSRINEKEISHWSKWKKKKDDVLFIKLLCYSIIRPLSNSLGLFYQAVLDCFQELRGGKIVSFPPFVSVGQTSCMKISFLVFIRNRNKDMMKKKERKSAFTLRSLNFPFISNCPDFSG